MPYRKFMCANSLYLIDFAKSLPSNDKPHGTCQDWNHTIRLVSVIYRTLVVGVLTTAMMQLTCYISL